MKLIQSVASLKNLQHKFPKMRGGGSKAVWNFSENSSVLEGVGVPNWEPSIVQSILFDGSLNELFMLPWHILVMHTIKNQISCRVYHLFV